MTLPEFCRRALKVPYVQDGDSWAGWDCWGLLRSFYRHCYQLRIENYRRRPRWEGLAAEKPFWLPVPPTQAREGDAVLFRGKPFHVGIIIEPGKMLHAYADIGTAVEKFTALTWSSRLVGIFRHAQLNTG